MKAHPSARRADVPPHLRAWLFDSRSLTRRLSRHCDTVPEVRLLAQRWWVPWNEERAALGLRAREYALVREVVLACSGEPWIFARSVFPRGFIGRTRWRIHTLGQRSLGDVLFSLPGMQRVEARVSAASPGDPLWCRAARALHAVPAPAWQRQSLFGWHSRSLLVSELFLAPLCRSAGDG